jgi:hypothetical protein
LHGQENAASSTTPEAISLTQSIEAGEHGAGVFIAAAGCEDSFDGLG